MVRLAGIEPTTPWFVAKYSIQLSYSREALDYITQSPESCARARELNLTHTPVAHSSAAARSQALARGSSPSPRAMAARRRQARRRASVDN